MIYRKRIKEESGLLKGFFGAELRFFVTVSGALLGWTGWVKNWLSRLMYRQRGRFSQSFVHMSMGILAFVAIMASSKVEALIEERGDQEIENFMVLTGEVSDVDTLISDLPKGEITDYRVQQGDTVSSIAHKFGVSIDTVVWENEMKSVDDINVNQILRILPVTGVIYKVKRGETIYSIAKKYSTEAQSIIDYPFNVFSNDETFSLLAGQELILPDGVKPKEVVIDKESYVSRSVAAIPGVVGEGSFMWPTTGRISQRYSWYHKAVDIANKNGSVIVAAQGGTVVTSGWGGGYGNY
ncbi:LysM peptidoglycan-binding domain-containing protein, partial [Patescibacteria group bacterium]|nr:LysM peptidoglycan-binding domain-containing protein [Patescibacteria group bacterium]